MGRTSKSIWRRRITITQPWRAAGFFVQIGVTFVLSASAGSWLLLVLAVWVLVAEFLGLMYWLADRRYRRRAARLARGLCGKCGYDLAGTPRSPTRRCPECNGWNPAISTRT